MIGEKREGAFRLPIRIGLVLIALMLVITAGCGEKKADEVNATGDYKIYKGKDFTLEYPINWVPYDFSKSVGQSTSTIKVAYIDSDINIEYRDSVNVEIQENPILAPGAEYTANLSRDQFVLSGASFGLSEYKKISYKPIDYEQYKAGLYTASYVISQTGLELIGTQYIVPIGKNTYILTYTTTKGNYDDAKVNIIAHIIAQFKIT